MKILMLLMIAAIIAALSSAGVFMLRKGDPARPRSKDMARALALRVALSIALFLFILFSWRMGWLHPKALPLGS